MHEKQNFYYSNSFRTMFRVKTPYGKDGKDLSRLELYPDHDYSLSHSWIYFASCHCNLFFRIEPLFEWNHFLNWVTLWIEPLYESSYFLNRATFWIEPLYGLSHFLNWATFKSNNLRLNLSIFILCFLSAWQEKYK